MWKIRQKIAEFMYGRYGADSLTRASLVAYLLLFVANALVSRLTDSAAAVLALSALEWALIIWTMFRMLSRDIGKRYAENEKFMHLWGGFKSSFIVFGKNLSDRGHKYVRCPSCGAIIRFPRKKGRHSASCPKCRAPLTVTV